MLGASGAGAEAGLMCVLEGQHLRRASRLRFLGRSSAMPRQPPALPPSVPGAGPRQCSAHRSPSLWRAVRHPTAEAALAAKGRGAEGLSAHPPALSRRRGVWKVCVT
eukprot:2570988-Rhodomonas_salina.3